MGLSFKLNRYDHFHEGTHFARFYQTRPLKVLVQFTASVITNLSKHNGELGTGVESYLGCFICKRTRANLWRNK